MASSAPRKGRPPPRIKPSTIDEEYKIQISKRLTAFRDSDEQVLVFPKGLDNQERKYVHELCLKLGLLSKSTGSGENRYLTVRKPIENMVLNEKLPVLQLLPACQAELEDYFRTHPIKQEELDYVLGRATKPFLDNFARIKYQTTRPTQTAVQTVSWPVPPVIPSRMKLPTWNHREEIIRCIRDHIVTIVSGETGSGKSSKLKVQGILFTFI